MAKKKPGQGAFVPAGSSDKQARGWGGGMNKEQHKQQSGDYGYGITGGLKRTPQQKRKGK